MSVLNHDITIAIDGYSSCGKSTLAKELADELNYVFIDTGAMYRGITLFALDEGLVENGQVDSVKLIKLLTTIELRFDRSSGKARLILNQVDVEDQIRGREVNSMVSKVAAIKEVRDKLVEQQRNMGNKGGVVMDGRDIGSVVFPNAELKLFIIAGIDIRVERRFQELKSKEVNMSKEEVKENLLERDRIDSTRKESPLIQVEDAIVIDNSELTKKEQLALALKYVHKSSMKALK